MRSMLLLAVLGILTGVPADILAQPASKPDNPLQTAEMTRKIKQAEILNKRAKALREAKERAWVGLSGNSKEAEAYNDKLREVYAFVLSDKLTEAERKDLRPTLWSAVFAAETAKKADTPAEAWEADRSARFLRLWLGELLQSQLKPEVRDKLISDILPLIIEGHRLASYDY